MDTNTEDTNQIGLWNHNEDAELVLNNKIMQLIFWTQEHWSCCVVFWFRVLRRIVLESVVVTDTLSTWAELIIKDDKLLLIQLFYSVQIFYLSSI